MSIDKERLCELDKFSVAEFCQWFINGFKRYFDADIKMQFKAFEPLHAYIGLTGDLTKELGDLYTLIKKDDVKERFENALVECFNVLSIHESNAQIVKNIMFLSGYAKINKLILPIVEAAEKGFFIDKKNNINKELFVIAIDVVKHLSERDLSGDPMRRLIRSRYFKSIYAPKAFISLCKSEPNNYPMHLRLLRDHFFEIHKYTTENIHITAKRFLLYVGLETIAKEFNQIYLIPWARYMPPSDDWLIRALFMDEEAPLNLTKENSCFVIIDQKNDKKVSLNNLPIESTQYLNTVYFCSLDLFYRNDPIVCAL